VAWRRSSFPSPLVGEGGARSAPGEGEVCQDLQPPHPPRSLTFARHPIPQGEREKARSLHCGTPSASCPRSLVVRISLRSSGLPFPSVGRPRPLRSSAFRARVWAKRLTYQPQKYRHGTVQPLNVFVAELPNAVAELAFRDGKNFVDHDTRGKFKAVQFTWLDRNPKHWHIGLIAGETAKRDGIEK